jgi:RES domain-containing protein
LSFQTIRRGGPYFRVADPSWEDPLEGEHSKAHGGRWNIPGSFPVVYLNGSYSVARANVRRKFAGLPYGPEDLDPAAAPVLVGAEVPEDDFVDVVTDEGCMAVGLPDSYPRRPDGEPIGWRQCQPIGQRAWDEGLPGIACRSAAPGAARDDEELAWFQRSRALRRLGITKFDDWFWPE